MIERLNQASTMELVKNDSAPVHVW